MNLSIFLVLMIMSRKATAILEDTGNDLSVLLILPTTLGSRVLNGEFSIVKTLTE